MCLLIVISTILIVFRNCLSCKFFSIVRLMRERRFVIFSRRLLSFFFSSSGKFIVRCVSSEVILFFVLMISVVSRFFCLSVNMS